MFTISIYHNNLNTFNSTLAEDYRFKIDYLEKNYQIKKYKTDRYLFIAYDYEPNTYFNACISKYPNQCFEKEIDSHSENISKNIINSKSIAICAIKNGKLTRSDEKYLY
tara:strand:+ start:2138 stop:2464 length:327 start_codon:yes stop_codon:yes gene_type:complete